MNNSISEEAVIELTNKFIEKQNTINELLAALNKIKRCSCHMSGCWIVARDAINKAQKEVSK